jgi:hypothetical protein
MKGSLRGSLVSLCTVVIGLWCALHVYTERHEKRAVDGAVLGTDNSVGVLDVKWSYHMGCVLRLRWTTLSPQWWWWWWLRGNEPYTVSIRARGVVEHVVCVESVVAQCEVRHLTPCTQYQVSVWRSANKVVREWLDIITPTCRDDELLCNPSFSVLTNTMPRQYAHWRSLMSPYITTSTHTLTLEGKYIVAQNVPVASSMTDGPIVLLLRARTMIRGAVQQEQGVDLDGSIMVDVYYGNGTTSLSIPLLLLNKRDTDVARWQSGLLELPQRPLALRVCIVFSSPLGVLMVEHISFGVVAKSVQPSLVASVSHAQPHVPLECIFSLAEDTSFTTLSIATHLTSDELPALGALARLWNGPISATIWVLGGLEGINSVKVWYQHNAHVRQWVSLHLVNGGSRYSNEMLNMYPINALRNWARSNARSMFVWEVDVDTIPSPDARVILERQCSAVTDDRTVIVVPSFEGQIVTTNKQSLLDAVNDGQTRPRGSFDVHGPTNYGRWYQSSGAFRTHYQSGWEPDLVVRRLNTPLWSEHFRGTGFHRASFAWQLQLVGYRFHVAGLVWSVVNDVKVPITSMNAFNVMNEFMAAKFVLHRISI